MTAEAARLVLAAAGDPGLVPLREGDPHVWRDAAVAIAAEDAVRRGDDAGVRALADGFGALLRVVPAVEAGELVLARVGVAERRRRGSFATPPALAAVLATHALPCVEAPEGPSAALATAGAASASALATAGAAAARVTATGAGRRPVVGRGVVDPACGTGALLEAAFDRMVGLGVPPAEALDALHGVDADPAAVAVCRAVLTVRARAAGLRCGPGERAALARRIVVGDALMGPAPRCPGEGLTWHEAFPDVLDREGCPPEPVTGWRGGFAAVLANPPWERLKVTRKDWAGSPPPSLRAARAAGARSLRDAGRHPLTGAGELNAYLPFVETCWRLLAPDGRAALVVPAGVASDRSSSALLRALLDTGALECLHLLDPPEPIFDGVSRRVGVAVVVLGAGPHVTRPGRSATVCVGVRDATRVPAERSWRLDGEILRLVNPNSTTAPLFGGLKDAELVTAAHRRHPVLKRRSEDGVVIDDPWQVRLVTPLHMTRDARHFSTAPGPGLLPLWEAKHAGLLDHRGGGTAAPRYWVPEKVIRDRYGNLAARGWLAGYRNVTTVDSPRTLVPTALPVTAVGNSLPLVSAPRLPLLLAALASIPVDHLARQKHAGANLNFFKLEQVPLPPPEAYDVPAPWAPGETIAAWVLARLAVAHAWDDSLAGFAAELAAGSVPVPAPDTVTPEQRALARADLDAAHAVLFGLTRADLEHVLGTFDVLAARERRTCGRFVTAERVLAAYDRLNG